MAVGVKRQSPRDVSTTESLSGHHARLRTALGGRSGTWRPEPRGASGGAGDARGYQVHRLLQLFDRVTNPTICGLKIFPDFAGLGMAAKALRWSTFASVLLLLPPRWRGAVRKQDSDDEVQEPISKLDMKIASLAQKAKGPV